MSESRFYIVGGGPAGAGAALAVSKLGYRPVVFEAFDRLAFKPCGNAVPLLDSMVLRIPRESIMNRVRRAKVWVDGIKIFEARGFVEGIDGFIVDKSLLLESAFADAGAELVFRAKYDVARGLVKTGSGVVEVKRGVFAGGFPYYDGDKVPIVQALARDVGDFEKDAIEVYYDSRLVGYYYVFPYGDKVEVGVGGYVDAVSLRGLLEKFVKDDPRLRDARLENIRFSQVSVGGPKPGYLNGLVKVGEAAGYVFPLTGEGIRPAALSGYLAARALAEGRDPLVELRKSWVHVAVLKQRRLLELALKLEPESRGRLLRSLSARDHAEVALGMFRASGIARIAVKLLLRDPVLALKALRAIATA